VARVSAVLAGLASTLDCARLPTFFVPFRRLLRSRSISRICLSRVRAFEYSAGYGYPNFPQTFGWKEVQDVVAAGLSAGTPG
jgi:hypothetical protein